MPTLFDPALRWKAALLVGLAVVGAGSGPARAQEHALVFLDDPAYTFITRLQQRGYLPALNPTETPYTRGEIADALAELDPATLPRPDRGWYERLSKRFKSEEERLSFSVEGGVVAAEGKRPDELRPLGEGIQAYPYAEPRLSGGTGTVAAGAGLRFDRFYDQDPDGLDAARRLMSRSENAYVGYYRKPLAVYLGRYRYHWAPLSEPALLLSDNALAFDHLRVRLGKRRLMVTGLLGELDHLSPEGLYTGEGFREGSRRRYLAAHRVDWRPSDRLVVSVMESVLYSGPSASPSLRFLNPLHVFIFEGDNKPKNDENNVLVALQVWARLNPFVLTGQFLLDDLVYQSDYPSRIAAAANVTYAPQARPFHAGASVQIVGSETYNTFQTEGQYLYLRRGLATAFSDYVRLDLFSDVFLDGLLPGATVRPYATLLLQGERDMRLPIASSNETSLVLHGDVSRTLRAAAAVTIQPAHTWWLRADAGLNRYTPADLPGVWRFAGVLRFGIRLEAAIENFSLTN